MPSFTICIQHTKLFCFLIVIPYVIISEKRVFVSMFPTRKKAVSAVISQILTTRDVCMYENEQVSLNKIHLMSR